ncbi:MAG: prepilin-type N-terminal cleavage/methylation domain-containing protein [Armatimonadota bacterium]
MRHCQRGLTLIEVLVAMGIGGIVVAASAVAFRAGVDHLSFSQRILQTEQSRADWTAGMRHQVACSFISADSNDSKTFFIATSDDASSDLGATRLTFTSAYASIPGGALDNALTFDDVHDTYGPLGGLAEVSYSTVAVGDAGTSTGLFERIQRPVDADPLQGGLESLVSADVSEIGFLFWDGVEWLTEWDTRSGTRRLPAAVRVQYRLTSEPSDQLHSFVIVVPTSDVTASNPVTQGAAQQ